MFTASKSLLLRVTNRGLYANGAHSARPPSSIVQQFRAAITERFQIRVTLEIGVCTSRRGEQIIFRAAIATRSGNRKAGALAGFQHSIAVHHSPRKRPAVWGLLMHLARPFAFDASIVPARSV